MNRGNWQKGTDKKALQLANDLIDTTAPWIVVIHGQQKLGMDQYLLIPFLGEWTSIYQLFWCSPGG